MWSDADGFGPPHRSLRRAPRCTPWSPRRGGEGPRWRRKLSPVRAVATTSYGGWRALTSSRQMDAWSPEGSRSASLGESMPCASRGESTLCVAESCAREGVRERTRGPGECVARRRGGPELHVDGLVAVEVGSGEAAGGAGGEAGGAARGRGSARQAEVLEEGLQQRGAAVRALDARERHAQLGPGAATRRRRAPWRP